MKSNILKGSQKLSVFFCYHKQTSQHFSCVPMSKNTKTKINIKAKLNLIAIPIRWYMQALFL